MANYLYNGVELPALPEWDKETYPYAVITGYSNELFEQYPDAPRHTNCLFVSDKPYWLTQGTIYGGGFNYFVHDLTDAQYWTCAVGGEDSEWAAKGKYSASNRDVYNTELSYDVTCRFMWANHDIMYGSKVALFASDPIPVNPAPTLDPTSLLMGWQVGNRIRGGA